MLKPIPISAAKEIAKTYGYDQVIIFARRCHDSAEPHGEHMTTYGRNRAHCDAAAKIGDFLKHKIMGWAPTAAESPAPTLTDAMVEAANESLDRMGLPANYLRLSEGERKAYRLTTTRRALEAAWAVKDREGGR